MSRQLEGHTVQRFDGELNNLHMEILKMGGLAQSQLQLALQALQDNDLDAAKTVLRREPEMDIQEVKLDDMIVEIIGRRSPLAKDLRITMAFSKTVTDLERVGDEALRIASLGGTLYQGGRNTPSQHLLRDISTMGTLVTGMLEESLDILDVLDAGRAEKLILSNGELDAEFQSGVRRLTTFVLEDARNVGHAITVMLIIKALERIGDHAINLAEYVIYLIKGKDVRHRDPHDTSFF